MALKYDIEIGTVYDIPMLAPAILGQSYENATVLALLDYSTAVTIMDVTAIHSSVYSLLPNGTPSDPSKLIYVKILTQNNSIVVIAVDWIASQPAAVAADTFTVTFTNTPRSQMANVIAVLNANGYNNITVA